MKKFLKELIIFMFQIILFYIFPFFAGPTDAMGMVFIIILVTFILSTILGTVSKYKIKFLYPVLTSIIFIPTVFIHYNSSALIHSLWYLVISSIGLVIGLLISLLFKEKK